MNKEKQLIIAALTVVAIVFINSILMLVGNPKLALMGFLLIPALVLSYCYPRWSLWAFLLYLPFAGTLTYYVPGVVKTVGTMVTYNNTLYGILHLAKDIFYFPALLAIIIKHRTLSQFIAKHKPIAIAVGILFLTTLLTLIGVNLLQPPLSPRDQPFLMGIIGAKIFIGYIPLILVGYYLMRRQKDIFWFNRIFTVLILLACGLAFIQYFFLLTGVCPGNANLPEPINAKATLQARCFVGGSLLYNPLHNHVWYLQRLPGTFVSPWQWAWFLVSGSFITYATTFSDPSRIWRILGAMGIIFVLGASFISGQWTAFLVVPTVLVILMLVTETEPKKRWLKFGLMTVGGTILFTQIGGLSYLMTQFIRRWQYSPPTAFVTNQFQRIAQNNMSLLGQGLGRASSVARRLGEIQLVETFQAKVLYEVGILGFLAFLGLVTVITIQTFKAYRSLKTPNFKVIGLTFWIFILFISYNPYYYPLAVDPVAVYYWLLVGILLKLPEIENKMELEVDLPDLKANLADQPLRSESPN